MALWNHWSVLFSGTWCRVVWQHVLLKSRYTSARTLGLKYRQMEICTFTDRSASVPTFEALDFHLSSAVRSARPSYTHLHVSFQIFRDTQDTNFTNSGAEHVVRTCSYPLQYNLLIHIQTHTRTHTHTNRHVSVLCSDWNLCVPSERQITEQAEFFSKMPVVKYSAIQKHDVMPEYVAFVLNLGSLRIFCITSMWLW